MHTCTKDYLWASKQPLELPQYTLVHCNIQMWGSYQYKQAVSQRNGYSEQTEKQTQQYLFKSGCLQINKCKYPKSALYCPLLIRDSFKCLPKNGFIFIYQSYLLVTWVFVLSRLQTRRSAPPPFLVERQGSVTHKMFSTVYLHISLKEKGNCTTYSNWRQKVGH